MTARIRRSILSISFVWKNKYKDTLEAFHNQLSVIKRERHPPFLVPYLHFFSNASFDGTILNQSTFVISFFWNCWSQLNWNKRGKKLGKKLPVVLCRWSVSGRIIWFYQLSRCCKLARDSGVDVSSIRPLSERVIPSCFHVSYWCPREPGPKYGKAFNFDWPNLMMNRELESWSRLG